MIIMVETRLAAASTREFWSMTEALKPNSNSSLYTE
jgi:hypothetical protein